MHQWQNVGAATCRPLSGAYSPQVINTNLQSKLQVGITLKTGGIKNENN